MVSWELENQESCDSDHGSTQQDVDAVEEGGVSCTGNVARAHVSSDVDIASDSSRLRQGLLRILVVM